VGGVGQLLIEHWDGAAWSIVSSPNAGDANPTGISAVAANDIWAVGYANGTDGFVLHWDGTQWTLDVHAGRFISGVSARAANDVWAVGTQVEHWDGTQWTLVPSPDPSQGGGVLLAVDAVSATDVWGVGIRNGTTVETLTERYNDPCITPTPPPAVSGTPTATRTPGGPTVTATATVTPGGPSATPTATATVCAITFTDVDQNNPFYTFIRCLACRQIVSGYADGTFRWGNNVTRGQLSKIIANSANFQDPIPATQQTFEDVPGGPNPDPFWLWIERLAGHGAISGYTCGGVGEPCVPPGNRPYFRPNASATRGQIAKIDAIAAQIPDPIPSTQQTFADVPATNPFWLWIEQLAGRQIISGYQCGTVPFEPCDLQNRPYFRPGANTTRGQMAKIAANTFYPNCQSPAQP
jgi:hypothetical protein